MTVWVPPKGNGTKIHNIHLALKFPEGEAIRGKMSKKSP